MALGSGWTPPNAITTGGVSGTNVGGIVTQRGRFARFGGYLLVSLAGRSRNAEAGRGIQADCAKRTPTLGKDLPFLWVEPYGGRCISG